MLNLAHTGKRLEITIRKHADESGYEGGADQEQGMNALAIPGKNQTTQDNARDQPSQCNNDPIDIETSG